MYVHHFYHVQMFNVMFQSEYIYAQLVMYHLRLVTVVTVRTISIERIQLDHSLCANDRHSRKTENHPEHSGKHIRIETFPSDLCHIDKQKEQ